MKLYMIRRRGGWASPEELEATAVRSREVAESEFPQDISWIRSYVVEEEGGEIGTVCIYEASDEDAVRRHADRVEMPADEVRPIADTVIIRPDPERAPA
jgi:sporulation protein YlmC with PRC-barrel domain